MLDGYKTYLVAAFAFLAALASLFGSYSPNEELTALLFVLSAGFYSLRDAIKKLK